jgi:hypothetical protein
VKYDLGDEELSENADFLMTRLREAGGSPGRGSGAMFLVDGGMSTRMLSKVVVDGGLPMTGRAL